MKQIKAIFGLGNPGIVYENTRHNVGFMFVDYLLGIKSPETSQFKHNAEIFITKLYGKKVFLVKPQTFMNMSGLAYINFIRYNSILPEETVVVYDDVDIPIGRIRIRERGSHGGHRGLKSIIEMAGTENIPRIRIGIGREEKIFDLSQFVLSQFSEAEFEIIHKVLKKVYEAFKIIIHRGILYAMSEYNKLTIDGGK